MTEITTPHWEKPVKTFILIPDSSYVSVNSKHLCSKVCLPFSSSLSRQFKTHDFPSGAKKVKKILYIYILKVMTGGMIHHPEDR